MKSKKHVQERKLRREQKKIAKKDSPPPSTTKKKKHPDGTRCVNHKENLACCLRSLCHKNNKKSPSAKRRTCTPPQQHFGRL